MPNRKSKKAEREKAAKELEDMPGVDLDFKERQDLQDKLYGSASSTCGNLECKCSVFVTNDKHHWNHQAKIMAPVDLKFTSNARVVKGRNIAMLNARKQIGPDTRYASSIPTREQVRKNHLQYFCNSFSATKIGVNKLCDKMGLFLQLFMSFPEHVSDFILYVRGLAPEERGGHCSIHFRNVNELQKWTKVLESQQLVELSRIIARTVFYSEEKAKRLQDAFERTAVHRQWIDNNSRLTFEKFLIDSLQWDDEEGIMAQFRAAGIDLGPSGMVLGISCIVNPADGSQTNILTPFIIKDPPISPEDRKPRELTSLEAAMPGDEDFQCPTQ